MKYNVMTVAEGTSNTMQGCTRYEVDADRKKLNLGHPFEWVDI